MPARRVLIVDDNELNLRLAETILTHAGFAITVARTAQEARGELAGGSWDALLVDLRLPDGDGMEIVRRLRARPETATMRIAALTASPVTGDARLALEAGCDVAITKPLEVRSFADAVRSLIGDDRSALPGVQGTSEHEEPIA